MQKENVLEMDRQFDFRALLLKIQDRLSNDDRRRLHFLVGDIIPRMQREDVTLGGTLTVLESLFDRAVINEGDLNFLIRIFREIQCYDVVKRLQEYQLSKEPSRERQLTVSDVIDDNIEEDKHRTIPYEQLPSNDDNSHRSRAESLLFPDEQPNPRKLTTTESLNISPETTNKPVKISTVKSTSKTFCKLPLIYCLYILFFIELLLLLIYLWIFVRKKLSLNIIENRYHNEAYILKNGKFPAGIDGQWFNHSEDLFLTYADRLIRIDALVYHDDMYSIKFFYSQNKSIEHILKNFTRWNQPTLSTVDFKQRNIQEITQCYKTNNGSTRLVGLYFAFKDKSSILLGSCHEQIYSEDKFSNHIFGYATGKTTQYLNGLQFVWYKICSLHNRVTFCANHNPYRLLLDAFYKD